jgi:hypothetical protein
MSDLHVDLARQWAAEQRANLIKIEAALAEVDRDLMDASAGVVEHKVVAIFVFFVVAAIASALVAGFFWLVDSSIDEWLFVGGVVAGTVSGTATLTMLNTANIRHLQQIRDRRAKLQHRRDRALGAAEAFEGFSPT